MKNFIIETQKLLKGLRFLLLFNLIILLSMFVIHSCQREQYERSESGIANVNFTNMLKNNKRQIGHITISLTDKKQNVTNRLSPQNSDEIISYLEFPSNTSDETINLYQQTNSINELANLIDNHNARLQYEETSSNSQYPIILPIDKIKKSLSPLVREAKNYLISKGFTENDIEQMIAEENAEETDLIPLVMVATETENGKFTSNNLIFFPSNFAYAKLKWSEVGHCALHALGADIVFSLASSSATFWTVTSLKVAFKTVAKRALGPIGAAIAVVDFGLCLGGVEL